MSFSSPEIKPPDIKPGSPAERSSLSAAMYLWRCLFIFSAMAATGDCVKCITCMGLSDSCPFSFSENCPDGQVCASQYRISIGGGIISQFFYRVCAPQSECSVTGTFTSYSTEKIATTCCFKDLCTPEKPKLPATNPEPNGVMCPSCTEPGDPCPADQKCTGNETMCLLKTTESTIGDQTLTTITRGCASYGYCNKNYETSSDGMKTTYTCTNGTRPDIIPMTSTPNGTPPDIIPTKSTPNGTHPDIIPTKSTPNGTRPYDISTSVTVAGPTQSAHNGTRPDIIPTQSAHNGTHNGTSQRSFSLCAVVLLFILLMLM